MRVIGVTGSLCSGKSTVARLLAAHGATVIDADAVVHEALAPGHPVAARVVERFGSEIVDVRGAIDRRALGDRVFADPAALEQLTQIVHPHVGAHMRRQLEAMRQRTPEAVVVLDVPLLFEAGLDALVDVVVVVSAPESVLVARARERWHLSEAAVRQRLAAQWTLQDKRDRADFVVDNGGTLMETEKSVEVLWPKLLKPVPRG